MFVGVAANSEEAPTPDAPTIAQIPIHYLTKEYKEPIPLSLVDKELTDNSGIGGWIGLPVMAGLDLSDKFGAIGATAMTKAAGLAHIPQGGTLNVFRIYE